MDWDGRDFGDYRIIREIGRGGMGVVYLARQKSLGRNVALKILPGHGATPGALARFRREAEAASRLDHPSICAVYATGIYESTPFIAMRYLEGLPLSRIIEERRRRGSRPDQPRSQISFSMDFPEDPPTAPTADAEEEDAATLPTDADTSSSVTREDIRWAIRLGERVARALHVAHGAHIVHRDIKPGNIILGTDDEPVVLDFGLARYVEGAEGPSLTQTGDLMGTPHYMPPEQIRGSGTLDGRADVYSLGVTLYELITLRRPFEAPNRETLYRNILHLDPPTVRTLNPRVERDLEIVLSTAMEKDLDRRYASAEAFADDLRAVLDDEEIAARPLGPILRARKWVRRNPVVTAALAFVFLALVGALLEATFFGIKIQHSLDAAEAARAEAEVERHRATEALRKEEQALEARETALQRAQALRLAAEAQNLAADAPAVALGLAREAIRRVLIPETDRALRLALRRNPEERLFGGADTAWLAARRRPTDSADRVLDLSLRNRMPAVGAVHPQAGHIVTHQPFQEAAPLVWDLETGRLVSVLSGHQDAVASVRLSPDGSRAITAGADRVARVFDLATGAELLVIGGPESRDPHGSAVQYAHFDPSGGLVATVTVAGKTRIWDATTGELRARLPAGRYRVAEGPRTTRFHPKGGSLATIKTDQVDIWSLSPGGGRLTGTVPTPRAPIWGWCFSREGRMLAVGDHRGRVHVFAIPDPPWVPDQAAKLLATLEGPHEGSVRCLRFSPDGSRLTSGGSDGRLVVWDLDTRDLLFVQKAHEGPVLDVAFSPTGRSIATGGTDGRARVAAASDGRELYDLVGHQDWVNHLRFIDDGRRLMTLGVDGSARIFSLEYGAADRVLLDCAAPVASLALSHDGTQLIATSERGELHLVDFGRLEPIHRRFPELGPVRSARFASDRGDEVVVAGGEDSWLRLISTDRGEPRWALPPSAARQRRDRASLGDRHILLVDAARGRVLGISPEGVPVAARLGEESCLRMDELRSLKHVIIARPRSPEILIWPRSMAPVLVNPDVPEGIRLLSGVGDPPEAASFSPDGRLLALTTGTMEVTVLSIAQEGGILRLGEESCPPVWSPRGDLLICALPDGSIQVLDPLSNRVQLRLADGGAPVRRMLLSPEGSVLAAMTGEELQLWNLHQGRLRSATRTGGATLRDWCFSGDGSRLVMGLEDGTVRLVHVHPERTAPRLETRPLSSREMIRFDVGAPPERSQRRSEELALKRRIDLESLTGRIRTSRSPRNLRAYAQRILSDHDPIADLFPEALEATIEALNPLARRDHEALALLAKAQFLNGHQAEAVTTAGDALALLPSNHPFRPRIITALVAYQSAMVGELPRPAATGAAR